MATFQPFDHSPMPPSHQNVRRGHFLPTPHLPLVFRRDRVVSTTPQCPPRIEARDGGISTHPTPSSRVLTRWGCFDHSPTPPWCRNARRGHFYPPHTSLSRFDVMGVFRPLPNAPLASKHETGAFLPTPHLPLAFQRDGGVSTTPQRETGGFVPTPTPPSRILM